MLAVILYSLGLLGFVSYFLRTSAPTAKRQKWSALETVGVTIFIYFAGQLIGGFIAYGIARLVGHTNDAALDWLSKAVNGQFVGVLFIEIVSICLLYVFLRRRAASWQTIGLKGHLQWSDIGYVLSGYLVYFVLYLVIVNVVTKLVPSFNVDQQQQIGFEAAQGLQLVPVFISLVVLPPIAEELLMRGFLYTGLRQQMPKVWAAIATSVLFAAAHLQAGSGAALLWVAALDTFILSLVLVYLREKTGKLWAPIGLHSLKNFIAFLSLFVFHIAK